MWSLNLEVTGSDAITSHFQGSVSATQGAGHCEPGKFVSSTCIGTCAHVHFSHHLQRTLSLLGTGRPFFMVVVRGVVMNISQATLEIPEVINGEYSCNTGGLGHETRVCGSNNKTDNGVLHHLQQMQ